MISLILIFSSSLNGVMMLEIDSLKKAKVVDPMDQVEEFRKKDKDEQLAQYKTRLGLLKGVEIQRLKKKQGYKVVTEFDCGKGARRRRKE